MIIAVFLIPFIEHLTERTKMWFIDHILPDSWPSYLGHWIAPIFAISWSVVILVLINRYTPEAMIVSAGGSVFWYEISSLWRQKKREAVPTTTKGLEKGLALE